MANTSKANGFLNLPTGGMGLYVDGTLIATLTTSGFVLASNVAFTAVGTTTLPQAVTIGGIDYTFPADNGDAGEQLQTNGSGVLTWEASGV